MRKIIILILLILIPIRATATEYDSYIANIINETDLSELEKHMDNDDYKGFSFKTTLEALASGKAPYNGKNILKAIIDYFFKSLSSSANLTLRMVSVAILSAVILHLKSSFGDETGDAAFYACLSLVGGYGIKTFTVSATSAMETIKNITAFMNALIPTLLTFAATGGKGATATAIHPVMFTATAIITTLIGNFILPLIYIFVAVKITDCFVSDINLDKIGDLIKKVIKWTIGIVLTVFIGLMGIYSGVVPKVDAITLKTAKFAVGSFIPVVGGLLSDSVDMVIACSQVLKNSVGIAGVICIAVISFYPAIKIMAESIIMNISSSIISIIGDKRISKAVSVVAEAITMTFSMMITVTVMLIIIITFVVCLV